MAAAACLLALLAAVSSFTSASPPRLERPFEILAPQAASLAHDPLGSSDEPLPPNPMGAASEEPRSAHRLE
jgi:hypothetical protein